MTDTPHLSDIHARLSQHEREIADNRHGLNNAKQIFDIRMNQVITSIDELKNILKWAGGLIVTLMISFMSWSALQQYNANEAQKRDLQQQIELINNQEKADRDRNEIIGQLRDELGDSGGTVTPITPNSR